MKKVWFVEQGSYSDYRVVGVFSSEENAEIVCKAINDREHYGDASVDERPLDPCVKELNAGLKMFSVSMCVDGTTERCGESDGVEDGSVRFWDRRNAPAWKGKKGITNALIADVWAKDAAHAVKIVNEHRTRMLATGEIS